MLNVNDFTTATTSKKPTRRQLTEELIQLSLRAATIKRQLTNLDLPEDNEDIALIYEVFEEEIRDGVRSKARSLNEPFTLLFNNTF